MPGRGGSHLNQAVTQFKARAAEFCGLIERAGALGREELLVSLADKLPRLYAAGATLPNVAVSEDDHYEETFTRAEWTLLHESLKSVLGESDLYWTTPASDEEDREMLAGSLTDDLADIYRDLMSGLRQLERGVPESEVVWEWRFGLWTHWGNHAVEALRAVHAQLAQTLR